MLSRSKQLEETTRISSYFIGKLSLQYDCVPTFSLNISGSVIPS